MVSFLEEAIKIAKNKEYELIWKWPDIAHDNLIKGLFKVKGILNKLNYELDIMSPHFNGKYAPYSCNITNSESVNAMVQKGYNLITLSVELSKEDYKDLMENIKNPEKIEVYSHGNIELMKSRYLLFNSAEICDKKGKKYPVYKNLSSEELIILNHEDYSILDEIEYLKTLNITNFSIDGRWKDIEFAKTIDLDLNKKYSSQKFTQGNY